MGNITIISTAWKIFTSSVKLFLLKYSYELIKIASSKRKTYLFTYIVDFFLSKCGECCWMNKRREGL